MRCHVNFLSKRVSRKLYLFQRKRNILGLIRLTLYSWLYFHETDSVNSCLCQVALLVQFLIENSGEIFGGDIAALFQRPDKKTSKNSEECLGKLVILYLPEMFKIF